MRVTNYKELERHKGHKVAVVGYSGYNIAIKCEDCQEVLLDFDR